MPSKHLVFKISFFAILCSIFLPGSLFAQTPNFPQSDQASVIGEKVRKEAEKKLQRKKPPTEMEEEREAEKPAKAEASFLVRDVKLEGNTWLSRANLGPVIEPYLGQKQTLSSLQKLGRAIEQEYRKRGFISIYVYLPPQTITDDTVLLKVVEGKLGKVSVEGNRWFRKNRTLAYSKLEKGKVIRYGDIWESLFAMNQNSDRSVRAIMKKGSTPETTDVIFKSEESFPLHAGFSYDDEGNRPSGLNRFGFNLRDNNLLTLDDVLLGGVVFGSDFGVVYTQYLLPIPETGTKLIFGYSHAQVAPKKDFRLYGINSISNVYFFRVEQALLSGTLFNVNYRLGMDLGFEFKNSRTKALSEPFRKDKLRVLKFGPHLQTADRWGVMDFLNTFAFGINGLGAEIFASPDAARQGVEPNFFYYHGDYSRMQKMPYDTRLNLRASIQLTSDQLPSSEALYLGGASSVRGYPEGDYLADKGFVFNFEYLVPTFFIPHDLKLPYSPIPLWKQVEMVAFLDYGYGWLNDPSNREFSSRELMGIGGGFRVNVYKNLFFRADWGQPIGDSPLSEGNADHNRFHFRLQTEI